MHGHDLIRHHTVYACVMGSRAFGLATDASDTDRRGVYVAPTPLFWRLTKPPTHVEGPAPEQFSWELERFCELALRANPNILECLHSPLVERLSPVGEELLALRDAFLSRHVHDTFTRYAAAQFKRLRTGSPHRGKPAMHLLRLLLSARDLLRTGELHLDVGHHRERLLAVKHGEVPWPDIESWFTRLTADTDAARVEDFLIRARRATA